MSVRQQVLDAKDVELVEVVIPGWGQIWLRPWDAHKGGKFLDAWDAAKTSKGDADLAQRLAQVAVWAVCEADGTPAFTAEDLPKLRRKSFRALSRLRDEVLRLNGLRAESIEDKKKDSPPTPAAASSSDSPAS